MATSKEEVTRFVQEISKELTLTSRDYPHPRIEEFIQAAKEHSAARDIMLEITQEILLASDDSEM